MLFYSWLLHHWFLYFRCDHSRNLELYFSRAFYLTCLLWADRLPRPHPQFLVPALKFVQTPHLQSAVMLISSTQSRGVYKGTARADFSAELLLTHQWVKSSFTFRLSWDLKLKPKLKRRNKLFKVIIPCCASCCPFLPSTSTDATASRVPSPDPAQLPRLRVPVSTAPPNLPAVPRTPPLHSTVPGTPAAHLAIPTVCVASWSRRIPASRPPTAHAPAPLPPSCQLNRLRAVHATPVLCLVVWVVPAVHSRPPVSWVFSAVFSRGYNIVPGSVYALRCTSLWIRPSAKWL